MSEAPMPRTPGLVGPHRESHDERLLLSNFRRYSLAASLPWDGSHGITDWGMDGNDQYGDCGPAATDHGNAAKLDTTSVVGTLGQPVYPTTLDTYFAYGIAQGEPPPHPDQGVDNSSWFGFLYQKGVLGKGGYGEVPLSELDHYAIDFNGVVLGVQLSDNAQQQFQQGIAWGQPGDSPDPNLGHDILLIGLDVGGGGTVVTWGALQKVTAAFLQNFVTDAWAFLDEDDANRVGINWAALQEALTEIHGTVTPPAPAPAPQPTPPSPTPTPTPPAPPVPSPEVLTWWEDFLNWLKSLV